jgi:hypothetical protein
MKNNQSYTEVHVLLDNIGRTKENIWIVKNSNLQGTGFSSEKNRQMYLDACERTIEKYRKRLRKLGFNIPKYESNEQIEF